MDTTNGAPATSRPARKYHRLFASQEADVVLISDDEMVFLVHRVVLQLASGFFKTLLEMPRDSVEAFTNEPIMVHEKSDVFEAVLYIVYPDLQLPQIYSLEFASAVLRTAEKYEMPKVNDCVRSLVKNNRSFLIDETLELYVLACRPQCWGPLMHLDAENFWKLFRLHRSRCQALIDALNPEHHNAFPKVEWINVVIFPQKCNHFYEGVVDCPAWNALMFLLTLAMDSQPLGDEIRQRSFMDQKELDHLWKQTCPGSNCGSHVFSKDGIHTELIRLLDLLPSSI
ncbi:hypothetical protein BD410DRAFT_895210 [Rickenella mellea]|uniref:BTB domain-containing protein n=1 Tax=Rickenella mellea TaxID=50990 RepID=A0A4Y7QGS9_9AGAM|nr:hypothetical protein BD410DRAFT_895210 [Rickenella mellea]